MAWVQVTVKGTKGDLPASMQFDIVECPNQLGKDPSTVVVDGKPYEVESYSVDERDDIIKIKLAIASTTKEKSDDKPTKGRS